MRDVKKVVEIKINKKWVENLVINDELEVYKSLTGDLINKKLNSCLYIKSIKRIPNYDGTQTITVTYNNDTRCVYTVKN